MLDVYMIALLLLLGALMAGLWKWASKTVDEGSERT